MGLALIVAFVLLLLIGVPVAVCLALVGIVYVLISGLPLGLVAQQVTYALNSFPLLAVPIFIFVGTLVNHTGITTRIFDFARLLIGAVSGGLAQVNILASLVFSGISGAALADIGGIGSAEIRAMRQAGYDRGFAGAVTCASATIGPIFPPSIPLIIYGAVAETSTIRLLLGGILPALLAVASLMVFTAYLARRRSFPKDDQRPTLDKIWPAFLSALPALITPAILIFGMLWGVFSPTEAAAVTAAYVLLISVLIYRDFTLRNLMRALAETTQLTAVIMLVVAAAGLFSWAITIEQVPNQLSDLFLQISTNPLAALLLAVLLMLIVGCFLESIAALLLLTPLLAPPLVSLGVDPVHLGVVMVYTLMLGLLTPPFGLSLFIGSSIARVPLSRLVREVIPYYIPLLAVLLIMVFFPSVVLWLPSLVP